MRLLALPPKMIVPVPDNICVPVPKEIFPDVVPAALPRFSVVLTVRPLVAVIEAAAGRRQINWTIERVTGEIAASGQGIELCGRRAARAIANVPF